MAIVRKTPKKQVVQYNYTLELSEDEASVIMALVGNVGGNNHERRLCGEVYQALRNVGLTTIGDPYAEKEQTTATKMSAKLKGIQFEE